MQAAFRNAKRQGNSFFPKPQGDCNPVKTLSDSDLQNCEISNLCSFKPLSLWSFISAAVTGSYHRSPRKRTFEKYLSHPSSLSLKRRLTEKATPETSSVNSSTSLSQQTRARRTCKIKRTEPRPPPLGLMGISQSHMQSEQSILNHRAFCSAIQLSGLLFTPDYNKSKYLSSTWNKDIA